ncbi:MAG: GntR family transcriptional regulator [Bacteroidetes bacterium]|nr:MAG: GntR family transcriptional regulator [Bacteroidota bacterium]
MIEIGKYNELTILRETSVGLYLGDESGEDVLLPNKYCPEKYELEDKISVFVYLDYAERKIATNITPKVLLNEFSLLRVTAIETVGAFMDWGLEKDLMVPFKEQRQRMSIDRWYIVYLDLDTDTDRLFASNRIEKHLQNENLNVEVGDEVDILIYHKTDLGFTVIVNHAHKGLVYNNEVFKELNIGDKLKGFVKNIREENKLDISLQPIGYVNYNDTNTQLVYQALVDADGILEITDKSSPEEIHAQFGISKKAFKKALGALYKDRKIEIKPEGIRLV